MEETRIIEVATFHPDHVQRINEMLEQLGSSASFTESDLKEIIASPNSHLFFLMNQNEIAGMLSVGNYKTPTGAKYWIEDVVIDNVFRGKSYGRMLIEYAIDYVGKQKSAQLMLTSSPKRIAANKLYQSAGFEQKETNVYRMLFHE